jgi:signal transduction histidine kinase
MAPVPWLPLLVLGAGLVSGAFLRYLWPYRDSPGGWFFIGTIACETLWIVAYGLALFVFDPALRPWFELPIWVGANFIGVCFLAFALEYTGRGGLVRSPWMLGLVSLQLLHTAIVATNPVHHIAWDGYQISPMFGAATVTYSHTLWLSVNFSGIFLMVAAGAFLLFDTFFSYGRLYRTQAAAIALSPVLPGLAFLIWLIQIGSSPPLNFTPLTFPVHLGFVFYAFFRRNMFELTPAARRASDRAAIEDLGSPVVVVDDGRRVINLNTQTRRVLGVEGEDVLGEPLDAILPEVDVTATDQTLSLTTVDGPRQFAATTAALTDASGRTVGHSVVLSDVTAEKRREQRLGVLNRVLRHNLRNDLNVVQGYIDLAAERVDDPEVAEMLETADEMTAGVVAHGEKARRIEETVSAEPTAGAVALAPVLEGIVADFERDGPDGEVTIGVSDSLRLQGSERLVDELFRNLLENALQHTRAPDPRAEVTLVEADGDTATIAVRDNGPGIPSHEVEVLEAESETPLEHGSGLGLWLVFWGVRSLGGELTFEADDAGTTVTPVLPMADERDSTSS